jgi:sucrose-6-phosphate hydrolase SacC (GH32 family)
VEKVDISIMAGRGLGGFVARNGDSGSGPVGVGVAQLKTRLALDNGRLTPRILVDRASVEVFANGGEAVIPSCFLPDENNPGVQFYSTGGQAKIVSMHVYPLRSAWQRG